MCIVEPHLQGASKYDIGLWNDKEDNYSYYLLWGNICIWDEFRMHFLYSNTSCLQCGGDAYFMVVYPQRHNHQETPSRPQADAFTHKSRIGNSVTGFMISDESGNRFFPTGVTDYWQDKAACRHEDQRKRQISGLSSMSLVVIVRYLSSGPQLLYTIPWGLQTL